MRNQPAIIALALAAFFVRGDANRIYELHSASPFPRLLRVLEVTSLPVDSVETIASITFFDPWDPEYYVRVDSGISLINEIKQLPEERKKLLGMGLAECRMGSRSDSAVVVQRPEQIVEDAGLDQHPTFEGIESDTDIDLYIEVDSIVACLLVRGFYRTND
ncbi:MAG: hypothetical protein R3C28_10025 [Pirellulaceae bacterium]